MTGPHVPLSTQIVWLFVLAAPVSCVAWTVTHEQVFAEVHDWCLRQSQQCRRVATRKFFYLFTCEYCFSHYVTAVLLFFTRFTLLLPGWRGYLIAGFALVWIANTYMSLFGRLRLDIKHERVEIAQEERPPQRPRSVLPARRETR